ncbi:MAG TPA: hypothetical protein VF331_10740 [Polyangiales bacterium]
MTFARTLWKRMFVTLPLLAGAASGCFASVGPDPVYVEADYIPPDVTIYPHTLYQGQVVYLVNDHWYYRDGPRWVYYRREPEVLVRQRTYVQQAPRAYPRGGAAEERRQAPEVQRGRPEEQRGRPEEQRGRSDERHERQQERREAPPATEVR